MTELSPSLTRQELERISYLRAKLRATNPGALRVIDCQYGQTLHSLQSKNSGKQGFRAELDREARRLLHTLEMLMAAAEV